MAAAKRGAESKVVASKAKAKPGSLGLAAEAKAAAEADAAAAAAKAARGEPEPESPLGDRIAVHTSEGVVRTKPGGGAPAAAPAKREAAEAQKQEAASSQAKAAGAPAAADFKKIEKKLSETLAKGLNLPKGAASMLCGVCAAPRKKSTGEPGRAPSPQVEGA